MSDVAERYRIVARGMTERVQSVPPAAWDNPAPCDGWVARDVIRHLVEWMPTFFLDGWACGHAPIPSVDDDPALAWERLRDALQSALDDPTIGGAERDTPMGRVTLESAFAMAGTPDVLVHTWDLARATGLDETLEPDEVGRLVDGFEGMDPAIDAAMRRSGHYGPRVDVPADADPQTRLLAFMGRRP